MTPTHTKAVHLIKEAVEQDPAYYKIELKTSEISKLKENEILVKISAAAYNRRELWQRYAQYPGIVWGNVIGADGAGTVVASATENDSLLQKRVFLVPMRGWESDPEAPENQPLGILGGGNKPPIGTFTEYVVVDRDQVIETPEHLDDLHAAAWPLAAVTAWRATIVNGKVKKGDNVFIVGIGGGVAIQALQFAVASGANVFVSSSDKSKIDKAVELGAKGGVNYKDKDWPAQLGELLKKSNNPLLDVTIDSAGGGYTQKLAKYTKVGGRFVVYGMTAESSVPFSMANVLKNQQLIGSTMGSHKDIKDATDFIVKHKVTPVVSDVLHGLESAEKGFEMMRESKQFGKIVIDLDNKKSSL